MRTFVAGYPILSNGAIKLDFVAFPVFVYAFPIALTTFLIMETIRKGVL
jgi:hypothetical protein